MHRRAHRRGQPESCRSWKRLDATTQLIVRERTLEVRGRRDTVGASARRWGGSKIYKASGQSYNGPASGGLVQVKPVVERLEADTEDLRRLALVSAAALEGREDVLALRFAERARHVGGLRGTRSGLGRAARTGGEILEVDRAVGHDECAVKFIPEFAHIAGPRVGADALPGTGGELLARVVGSIQLLQERIRQHEPVLVPLAKGRKRDGNDVEPVEQVFAEFLGLDRLLGPA